MFSYYSPQNYISKVINYNYNYFSSIVTELHLQLLLHFLVQLQLTIPFQKWFNYISITLELV